MVYLKNSVILADPSLDTLDNALVIKTCLEGFYFCSVLDEGIKLTHERHINDEIYTTEKHEISPEKIAGLFGVFDFELYMNNAKNPYFIDYIYDYFNHMTILEDYQFVVISDAFSLKYIELGRNIKNDVIQISIY